MAAAGILIHGGLGPIPVARRAAWAHVAVICDPWDSGCVIIGADAPRSYGELSGCIITDVNSPTLIILASRTSHKLTVRWSGFAHAALHAAYLKSDGLPNRLLPDWPPMPPRRSGFGVRGVRAGSSAASFRADSGFFSRAFNERLTRFRFWSTSST